MKDRPAPQDNPARSTPVHGTSTAGHVDVRAPYEVLYEQIEDVIDAEDLAEVLLEGGAAAADPALFVAAIAYLGSVLHTGRRRGATLPELRDALDAARTNRPEGVALTVADLAWVAIAGPTRVAGQAAS